MIKDARTLTLAVRPCFCIAYVIGRFLIKKMVTKLEVLTKEEGLTFLGDVNKHIEMIEFEVWDNEIVITHRKGNGLDFNRGDIRVEIEREEAIKMARSILFALNAL